MISESSSSLQRRFPSQPLALADRETDATAAGATGANNIGALTEANNPSDAASASSARINLGSVRWQRSAASLPVTLTLPSRRPAPLDGSSTTKIPDNLLLESSPSANDAPSTQRMRSGLRLFKCSGLRREHTILPAGGVGSIFIAGSQSRPESTRLTRLRYAMGTRKRVEHRPQVQLQRVLDKLLIYPRYSVSHRRDERGATCFGTS